MSVPVSVRLKLDRAQEHLQRLDEEIGVYLDRELYKLVLNTPPNNDRLVLVEFHVITEPDDRLGVVIGDCLSNIRSALEHLMCQLVESKGGMVTRETQFPIRDVRRIDKAGKPVPLKVAGLTAADVLALIDALQPYQRGGNAASHPLSVLRKLSNTDKHRLLHVTAAHVADATCSLRFPDGRLVHGAPADTVACHEAPIAAFQWPEPFDKAANAQVQVEASGSAFVAIKKAGPWSGKPVAVVLEEILQFTRDVVVAGLHPFVD